MGELTRRAAALTLLSGLASCSSADDRWVRVLVPSQQLGAFEAGLAGFARTQRLRMRRGVEREYNLEGRGIYIFVRPSPPANEMIEFLATIKKGLFSTLSSQEIVAVADGLVQTMNSIEGISGALLE